MYKTRREINAVKKLEKYKKIYNDVQDGVSFETVAKRYGYKNANSVRTTYYQIILPRVKYL